MPHGSAQGAAGWLSKEAIWGASKAGTGVKMVGRQYFNCLFRLLLR
jgi:hypothetical protein